MDRLPSTPPPMEDNNYCSLVLQRMFGQLSVRPTSAAAFPSTSSSSIAFLSTSAAAAAAAAAPTISENWYSPSCVDLLPPRQAAPSYDYPDVDLLRLRVNSAAMEYNYPNSRTNLGLGSGHVSYDSFLGGPTRDFVNNYESLVSKYAMLANANNGYRYGNNLINAVPTPNRTGTCHIKNNTSAARKRNNNFNYNYNYNNNNNMSNGGMRMNSVLPSWEELKGRFAALCVDETGSDILIRMLDEFCDFHSLEIAISEVKEEIFRITTDTFGNPVFNKLMAVCADHHVSDILEAVMINNNQFFNICVHSRGTYAVQKLVQRLNKNNLNHRDLVASAMANNAFRLIKDSNGNYVVKTCLQVFEGVNDVIQPILEVIGNNLMEIAKDKSGCCVLQQCLAQPEVQAEHHRLFGLIISNVHQLSENEYGNYVVQYLIGMRCDITKSLVRELQGSFAVLTKNKYGSHVVEKLLKDSRNDVATIIIKELWDDPHFVDILQDPMGNYVVQTALHRAKAMAMTGQGQSRSLHQILVSRIQNHYAFLQSNPYGKKVLSHTKCHCKLESLGINVDYRSY